MTNTSRLDKRRRFSRIEFHRRAVLLHDNRHWHVEIIDISLNGVLIKKPPQWDGDPRLPFAISIGLDNETVRISMSLALVHQESGRLGFQCQQMDLDSATHLKSLLMNNIGDPELINRQLSALIRTA